MIVVNVVDLAVVRGAVCLFVCLSVPIPAARCPMLSNHSVPRCCADFCETNRSTVAAAAATAVKSA